MKKFRAAVRVILILILTAALCAGLILTAVSASLRLAFTPENVYETMMNLDFAGIVLPDGYGGFSTILDSVNEQLEWYSIRLTQSDFNELVRMLSIDDIFTVFVQDFRTWLMDYGPVPALDPYEMAELALSGVNREILSFLSMFSDPLDTVAAFLARV